MSCIERSIEISFRHRVYFTRDVLAPLIRFSGMFYSMTRNPSARACCRCGRVAQFGEPGLKRKIEGYFIGTGCALVCPPMILEGGERAKNSYFHVSDIQSHIDRYHIDRHSFIVAVGAARCSI